MLITTIDELKLFLTVDKSVFPASFAPYVQQAEDSYIIKILGPTLYNSLSAAYTSSINSAGPVPMPADFKALWTAVNKANANLAWYLYAPINNVRISEAGINTSMTTDTERALKWQYDEMRGAFKLAGYNGIDALYRYLEGAAASSWYSEWSGSSAYSEYTGHFVKNCEIITKKGAPINYNAWLWMQMLPSMDLIEQLYIRPEVGEAFFDDLLNTYSTGTPSADQLKLIGMLQSAISLYTYADAILDPNFRQEIIMTGMTKYDQIPSTGSNRSDMNSPMSFSNVSQQYTNKATSFMGKIKSYLNAKASTVVFPLYFSSPLYVDPVAPPKYDQDISFGNATSSSFFL